MFCLALLATASAQADSPRTNEYRVKAAFLYHFTKFVEWPEGALRGDTLSICLLEPDPFGEVIDKTLRNKTAEGRRLTVRRTKSVGESRGCNILFVGSRALPSSGLDLAKIPGTLVVAESEDFEPAGSMIQLVVVESKVNIGVDLEAAQAAGFEVSSQLLRLARVHGESRGASR